MNPPPPPTAGPTLAFLERALVQFSRAATLESAELREAVRSLVERTLASAPQLIADHPHSQTTLDALGEALSRMMETGGSSPLALERGRASVDELLILHGTGSPSSPPIPPLQAARSSFDEIASLPLLTPISATGEAILAQLAPGDFLLAEERLAKVRSLSDLTESYEGQTWSWIEADLRDLATGRSASLSWEDDDGIEAWITFRSVPAAQAGLDAKALRRFDDRESGTHNFEGGVYRYSDSGEALRSVRGSSRKEMVFYVEFEGPGGVSLSVEDYDGEVEAHLSRQVPLHTLRLFRGQAS